jgi:tRNA(adenine34) deaminase
MLNKNKFMLKAIDLAKNNLKNMIDVPVASLIVLDNKIIAKGVNSVHKKNNIILHAEVVAILNAMKKLKKSNLINCDLYTTLEPCIMCSGAIIEAKIKRVFVGAHDTTKNNIGLKILIDNKIEVYDVICMEESKKLLDSFFENLRNKK